MQDMTAHPDGILAVDSGYVRPGLTAIHIVIHQGRAAIVDAGVNASVPRVLAALVAAGIEPGNVDWIVLTHIHLDHAGGAGSLLCAFPHAKVLVHPHGVRHILDPSWLWESSAQVLGAARTFESYGRLVPIPAERVVEADDGMSIDLAGRRFTVLYTPGHDRHHIALWDETARVFFAGDAFGVSYRELDVNGRPFVLPSTAPYRFDPEAMHASIDKMLRFNPSAMFLAHYSRVVDVPRLAGDLHRLIDAYVAVAQAARGEGVARHLEILAGLEQIAREEAERQGWVLPMSEASELLRMDLDFNAHGLGIWLDECRMESALVA